MSMAADRREARGGCPGGDAGDIRPRIPVGPARPAPDMARAPRTPNASPSNYVTTTPSHSLALLRSLAENMLPSGLKSMHSQKDTDDSDLIVFVTRRYWVPRMVEPAVQARV